jgi:stearoyl-CoA desaturase (delta-9 desaturase)
MTAEVLPNPANKPALSWVVVVFFSTVHLLALLSFWCFSWSALGVTLLLHWFLGSIGICLGYHRLLSHRSFQVPRWLEYTIALIGATALQGGPIFWVAGHRLHHAYTEDVDKDPYSARRGFWWSHMLWIFYPNPEFFEDSHYKRYAPDLARDPYLLLARSLLHPAANPGRNSVVCPGRLVVCDLWNGAESRSSLAQHLAHQLCNPHVGLPQL